MLGSPHMRAFFMRVILEPIGSVTFVCFGFNNIGMSESRKHWDAISGHYHEIDRHLCLLQGDECTKTIDESVALVAAQEGLNGCYDGKMVKVRGIMLGDQAEGKRQKGQVVVSPAANLRDGNLKR